MVEGSSLGVNQATFAKVIHVLKLVAVKASGNVNSLAPDKNRGNERGGEEEGENKLDRRTIDAA